MKIRNIIALGIAGSMLATAALADAGNTIMEEIVVTAPYPAHLLLEESIAAATRSTEPHSAIVSAADLAESLTRDITIASGLTDKIDFKPEIRLSL